MACLHRINFLLSLVAAAAISFVPAGVAAGPALVRTVRASASPQNARVVVDLSRPMAYQIRLSPDSTALVVAIDGAVSESSIADVPVGESGVRSVATRTVDAGSAAPRVEVTLLLDARIAWEDFALPAGEGRPARVVIDVRKTGDAPTPVPAAAVDSDAVATTPAPAPVITPPVPGGQAAAPRPFIVAIDAGHGGHDTGAQGRYGLTEKKMTLDLAQRVAYKLNRQQGIRAVMTRDTDTYLTLPERNEVAEKKNADVFVSIHINSAPSSSARGAEIYFVAPAGAERAADQEMTSGDAAEQFGLDQRDDGDIVHMLLDVNQQSILARSELLAGSILEEVRDRKLLPTRTVKQKSFSVLRTISMPSVLVECGFISNSADAKLLRDVNGRERIADAISSGVVDFFRVHPPQRSGAEPARVVHRVQRGDTLWTISQRYNTTVNRICELNGFGSSHALKVGQEILVERR